MHIYVISITYGGAGKYVRDLESTFNQHTFTRLISKSQYKSLEKTIEPGSMLILQHLYRTDFTFDDILKMVYSHHMRLLILIHDFYFLNRLYYEHSENIHWNHDGLLESNVLELFQHAERIIFPSLFLLEIFREKVDMQSMIVVPHIDYPLDMSVAQKDIRIGIITEFSIYKGKNIFLEQLFPIAEFRGRRITWYLYSHSPPVENVVVRGRYNENEIFDKLRADGIMGLAFINAYPETYSYALTKGIITGLPILYSDMGAIGERMSKIACPKYIATDNINTVEKFQMFLELMPPAPNMQAIIPPFYTSLFGT